MYSVNAYEVGASVAEELRWRIIEAFPDIPIGETEVIDSPYDPLVSCVDAQDDLAQAVIDFAEAELENIVDDLWWQ